MVGGRGTERANAESIDRSITQTIQGRSGGLCSLGW
jgi:hypothetical protein